MRLGVLLLVSLVACQRAGEAPPERPGAVPASAEWVGGADGGAWIDCKRDGNDPQLYACAVYHEGGNLWTEGAFEIRAVRWDEAKRGASYSRARQLPVRLAYRAFDGETIYLAGDLVLRRRAQTSGARSQP